MSNKGSELTPTEKQVFDKLKVIIAEQLAVEEDKVAPDATFVENLNADSLNLVNLIMEIEEKFSVMVPDDVAEKIVTVRDAVDYIVDKQE